MAWIYLLRGSNGRYYLGSTTDIDRRLAQHRRGHTHTTKRLGAHLELVASLTFETIEEARGVEGQLKRWKNPDRVLRYFTTHS